MDYINHGNKSLLNTIAQNSGFNNYEIEIKTGETKGEGYMGKIVRIAIQNQQRKIHLVLKLGPISDNFRKIVPVNNIFQKEIWIYETALKLIDNVQIENNLLDGFKGYAKCYGTCDVDNEEAIVMEDLIESGYRLWDRKKPMDHNHITIVMSEYGKFHAASLAMRHKDPKSFDILKKFLVKSVSEKEKESQKQHLKSYTDNVARSIIRSIKGYSNLENAFKKILEESEEFFIERLRVKENELVLTHGDCWCNNILFKYDNPESTIPIKVCFIDWQIARIGLPVSDIGYFFSTSSPKLILYQYKQYLKIYHDSLSNSLRAMSCDPEQLYPYALLEDHWKQYAKAALFSSPIIFSILAVDKEDVPNVDNIKSTSDYFEQLTNAGIGGVADERTKDLVEFFVDNNLL